MINSIENKINYQLLKTNEKYEIIIRAEKNNEKEGLSIANMDINVLNSIIDNVKDFTYSEVIKYLEDSNITYQKVEFV